MDIDADQLGSNMRAPIDTSDKLLRVFIGCDARQPVTYNVMQYSITRHSSRPVQVSPLYIDQLPITRQGLTPFTYTRFLVPWLCNYEGWALFTDADMLVQADLAELFACANEEYDVMVVQNPERFEWASVMLFNCSRCRALTPDYVQTTNSDNLFGMKWAPEVKIGSLPSEWNHLVGYSPRREDAKLIHYTQGSPMFPEVGKCEYSADWLQEYLQMNSFCTWKEIMGPSVHSTWLCGEQVPKLRVTDQLTHACEALDSPFSITKPDHEIPLGRENPSESYQRRLRAFHQRHIQGTPNTINDPLQIDAGTNILQLLGQLHSLITNRQFKTLLDYGCGKTLQYGPVKVNTNQGEQQVLLQQVFDLTRIDCYDPAYPPTATLPKQAADLVVCIDVLDRCAEEDLPWIVAELFDLSCSHVFIRVNVWDNGIQLDNGEPEVAVIKPKEWWVDLISTAKNNHPGIGVNLFIQLDAQGRMEEVSSLLG